MNYHYTPRAKKFARQLRGGLTDAEQKLWYILRRKQLRGHRFRRQFPIGNYIIDFYCPKRRLAIEIDGGQHNVEQHLYDVERTRFLGKQSIRVIRFWNNDVLQNISGVIDVIFSALERETPSSTSP